MEPRLMKPTDYEKGHLVVLAQLSPFEVTAITKEAYTEFASRAGRNVWVIEDAGRIIASGTLLVERKLIHCLSAVGHIEDIVVAADMRGVGIGRALIAHLVAIAKQQGCYKVILDCNEQKMPFYEACGFVRKGAAMAIYF
jgi:glucosamine-phosphate N-acetyltransferase